ncbi:putative lipoprotein [[Leptolyngbya] sp. PCC 7376]|uniref:hypothetical protein n=1 Tax=[Leptolyngbya] sp. PCC 7376 TaxID=111781 RepID=UPI00029F361D|nr:hypothetical protein [[Leptolyngbya] sp. PCC 7376]AFY37756.1 putative lipoprotein [[Leptolyngbya] sp. PCC 7376]
MTFTKFKNCTLLLLTLTTVQLSLVACGGGERTATDTSTTSTETTATTTETEPSTAEDTPTSTVVDTENWVDFTTENDAISVKFPGEPTTEKQVAPSDIGDVEFTMTTYADDSDKQFFMVSSLDYPVNPEEYDVEQGLEGAKNGALQNSGSTLISEEPSDRFGIPGKKLLMKNTEQGGELTIRAELYIDPKGPTLHQIMMVGEGDAVDTPEVNAFFDSAQITKL